MTRDSALLILGILGGVILYLASMPPPWEWNYYQWLQTAGAAISVTSAKLGNSPLKGEHD